ncbi:MAG: nicotinate (nicotinamide) nucleotide adenylyltransferase [Thermoanaerobaculia bacterium]
MNIGICGGTFDPFHNGHLEPVLAARELMEWERMIYVPAYRQPFKLDEKTSSGCHRFAMAVLATESIDEIFISPRELDRRSVSYTVETLEMLRPEYPLDTLDWIIGDDNLEKLGEWKQIERIFELANFVVLARHERREDVPGQFRARVTAPMKRGRHGSVVFADNATVPISSTEIRGRVRDGQSIGGLVDPRVSHYIEHYRLYREAQP